MTDWAVVLECAGRGEARLDLVAVDRLVERLAPWRASALYNPVRYALQVVVEAADPLSALRAALDLHADAARYLELPAWELVRTEILTLAELDRSWDVPSPSPPLVPKRAWEISPSFAIRMHDASRALLRAESVEDLTAVLARFVRDVGGWVVEPGDPVAGTLSYDLSLGAGATLLAAAEPYSSGQLLLEEALPPLVDDARLVSALLRAAGGEPRELRSDG